MSETKPPAINRLDPAWAMFAAKGLDKYKHGNHEQMVRYSCDLADDMIRERDRRDREERE